jgi:F0F1-type ATP synthase membrane subunit b/b'
MAKLDLIPDLQIMLIQGALFGVAVALVKTQFISPYLKLRDKRTLLTEGNKHSAEEILLQCEKKALQIQTRIREAISQAQEAKIQKKDAATQKQKAIIAEAEAAAKIELRKIETEIQIELTRELQRQPAVVAKLTNELYTIAIS